MPFSESHPVHRQTCCLLCNLLTVIIIVVVVVIIIVIVIIIIIIITIYMYYHHQWLNCQSLDNSWYYHDDVLLKTSSIFNILDLHVLFDEMKDLQLPFLLFSFVSVFKHARSMYLHIIIIPSSFSAKGVSQKNKRWSGEVKAEIQRRVGERIMLSISVFPFLHATGNFCYSMWSHTIVRNRQINKYDRKLQTRFYPAWALSWLKLLTSQARPDPDQFALLRFFFISDNMAVVDEIIAQFTKHPRKMVLAFYVSSQPMTQTCWKWCFQDSNIFWGHPWAP